MADAHRPGTANTSSNEVPLQHEIDPFTPIIVNDQVEPIKRERPKLSETEKVSHRDARRITGYVLTTGNIHASSTDKRSRASSSSLSSSSSTPLPFSRDKFGLDWEREHRERSVRRSCFHNIEARDLTDGQ